MSSEITQEQKKTIEKFIDAVKFASDELAFKYLSICDFVDISVKKKKFFF